MIPLHRVLAANDASSGVFISMFMALITSLEAITVMVVLCQCVLLQLLPYHSSTDTVGADASSAPSGGCTLKNIFSILDTMAEEVCITLRHYTIMVYSVT